MVQSCGLCERHWCRPDWSSLSFLGFRKTSQLRSLARVEASPVGRDIQRSERVTFDTRGKEPNKTCIMRKLYDGLGATVDRVAAGLEVPCTYS